MNPNGYLEQVLESAVVVSWADLTRGSSAGLIHIEYGFASGGTLDYLKVWSSLTRGHWLLACEYWMSANTFHCAGIGFENGYQSEGLAHILQVAMQRVRASREPRAAGTASDLNAKCKRKGNGPSSDKRSFWRTHFNDPSARSRLRLPATRHFSEATKRRSRCGSVRGRPVLSSHFSPGFAPHVGHRTANAGFCLVFMATQCAFARQQNGQF